MCIFPTTPNIKSVDDGIYETFVQTNKTKKKTIRTMKSPVTVVLIVGICATKSSVIVSHIYKGEVLINLRIIRV